VSRDALVVRGREDPHDDLLCRVQGEHQPRREAGRGAPYDEPEVWRCERCGVPLWPPPQDWAFLRAQAIAAAGFPVHSEDAAKLNYILAKGYSYRTYGRLWSEPPDLSPYAERPPSPPGTFPGSVLAALDDVGVRDLVSSEDGRRFWAAVNLIKKPEG
jgi:hypothetical protein